MSAGGGGPMYRDHGGKLWVMIKDGTYVAVDESKDQQMIGNIVFVRDAQEKEMTGEEEFKVGLFSNIQWISVEDELPPRVVNVLISSGGVFGVGMRHFDHGEWVYVFLSKPTDGPITHWAHIPLGAIELL